MPRILSRTQQRSGVAVLSLPAMRLWFFIIFGTLLSVRLLNQEREVYAALWRTARSAGSISLRDHDVGHAPPASGYLEHGLVAVLSKRATFATTRTRLFLTSIVRYSYKKGKRCH